VLGAREVAGAVTAATLTTICVFLPIVFVQGIAGQLFRHLAITVCISLTASLAVSLTLIPSLAALDLREWVTHVPTLFAMDREATEDEPYHSLASAIGRFASWPFLLMEGVMRVPAGLLWLILQLGALPVLALLLHRFGLVSMGLVRISILVVPAVYLLLVVLEVIARPLLPAAVRIGNIIGVPPIGNGRYALSVFLTTFLLLPRALIAGVFAVLAAAFWLVEWLFHYVTWPLSKLLGLVGRGYPGGLGVALRLRWLVLVLAFGLFALALYAVPRLGTRLVPDLTQGEFAFRLQLPEGTPLESTAEVVARIEEPLVGDPRFLRVFSAIGSLPSAASGRQTYGENLAQVNVVLPEGAGEEEEAEAVARVREVLDLFPNVEAELGRPSVLTLRPPVAVKVYSDDLATLDRAATRVARALAGIPVLEDLTTTVEPGHPEVLLELDQERAGALGVRADQISQTLRRQIRGDVVGEFREGEERIDIRLRVQESFRDRAAEVESLRIRLPDGTMVPVSSVAKVTIGRGPATVRRSEQNRVAEVTAQVRAADLGATLENVEDVLTELALPAGAVAEVSGQNRELETSFASLRLALVLAIFLVYVVMAGQFESLVHPLVILLAVPLGAVGVIAALLVTETPLSVLALIGTVMLAGIVVNNAIVLVDAINRRRRQEHQFLDEAIVGAGRERLRPILMTTTTTVLALLPMAVGLGAGDELRAPLAITVIGGLTAATLLTLLVVPCLYRALSRREKGAAAGARAGLPVPGAAAAGEAP
jgi:HAE1 family hydrophobic/amphiphilic exporter-1